MQVKLADTMVKTSLRKRTLGEKVEETAGKHDQPTRNRREKQRQRDVKEQEKHRQKLIKAEDQTRERKKRRTVRDVCRSHAHETKKLLENNLDEVWAHGRRTHEEEAPRSRQRTSRADGSQSIVLTKEDARSKKTLEHESEERASQKRRNDQGYSLLRIFVTLSMNVCHACILKYVCKSQQETL
jgi:hypothetical protein